MQPDAPLIADDQVRMWHHRAMVEGNGREFRLTPLALS